MTTRPFLAALLSMAIPGLARAQGAPPRDGWVVLPVEEYRALRERAYPLDPAPAPPPVDATLTRVDYELTLRGDAAIGEARLTVDVLKEGWVKVPVPTGLLVRGARIDGRPTAVIEGTPRTLLLGKPGRTLATLEVAVPVVSSAGTESVRVPSSASALTRVSLLVPRRGLEPTVTGGFLAESAETAAGTRLVAHAASGEPLAVSWRARREDHRASLPLRLRGAVTTLVALGEDATQLTSNVDVEVVQGLAPRVGLPLPDGVTVNQVSGAEVASWAVEKGSLEVRFFEPAVGQARFVVSAEARLPRDGVVSVPLLRLASAERETGGVGIEVLGAGEIEAQEETPKGLEPTDPGELGDPVAGRASPSLAAFRYRPQGGDQPRRLTLRIRRFTPETVLLANVDEARLDVVATAEGRTLVRARWAVRNNLKSFAALTLPAGATLWSASLAGRPVRPGLGADGTVLLPLEKGRSGQEAPAFLVEVVYLTREAAWPREGHARIALPALDLPVSRTAVLVRLPAVFDVEVEPGAFREGPAEEPTSPAFAEAESGWEKDEMKAAARAAPAGAGEGAELGVEGGVAGGLAHLVERFRKEGPSAGVAGVVPLHVPFPEAGAVRWLVTELTPEGSAPVLSLKYRRNRKGGRR